MQLRCIQQPTFPATQLEKIIPVLGQKRKPSFIPPTSRHSHPVEKCEGVSPPEGKSKPMPVFEERSESEQVPEKNCGNKENQEGGNQLVPQTTDNNAPPNGMANEV